MDSDTQTVYVANSEDNSVSVIDAKTRKTTATITVGDSPDKMGVDPESHLLYVANRGGGSISVVDPTKSAVVDTIAVGRVQAMPRSIRRPAPRSSPMPTTIGVGHRPRQAFGRRNDRGGRPPHRGHRRLRCAHRLRHQQRQRKRVRDRFAVRTVTDTIDVGDGPQTVAADPSTHTAWVVNYKDNTVSVIER